MGSTDEAISPDGSRSALALIALLTGVSRAIEGICYIEII